MAHGLVVRYGRPAYPAAFDRHYRNLRVDVATFATGGAGMASVDLDDVSPAG